MEKLQLNQLIVCVRLTFSYGYIGGLVVLFWIVIVHSLIFIDFSKMVNIALHAPPYTIIPTSLVMIVRICACYKCWENSEMLTSYYRLCYIAAKSSLCLVIRVL